MKALPLWVVQGTTGEYSDRKEWLVAACVSETAAQKLEDACVGWARALRIHSTDTDNMPGYKAEAQLRDALRNGWVPEAPDQMIPSIDYTGVDYTHYKTELRLHDATEYVEFADALIGATAGGMFR